MCPNVYEKELTNVFEIDLIVSMKNANFIKAQMLLNDVTAKDIASQFPGLSPQQVHGVIRGTRPTAYIRKAIAKAVNMSEEQLWPPMSKER